jgi:hypothetical protein
VEYVQDSIYPPEDMSSEDQEMVDRLVALVREHGLASLPPPKSLKLSVLSRVLAIRGRDAQWLLGETESFAQWLQKVPKPEPANSCESAPIEE